MDGRVPVIIATVLMGFNQEEVVELTKWAKKIGCASVLFQILYQNFGANYDREWHKKSEFWPRDASRMDSVIDDLIKLKREGMPILNSVRQLKLMKIYFRDPDQMKNFNKCKVGVSNFLIDPYGDTRLCYHMEPIGDIRQSIPSDFWNSKKAKSERVRIKNCERSCSLMNCNYP